jgi:hypothetical protein
MGNKGAFIRFEADLQPKYTTFGHVWHPEVVQARPSGFGGFDWSAFMR